MFCVYQFSTSNTEWNVHYDSSVTSVPHQKTNKAFCSTETIKDLNKMAYRSSPTNKLIIQNNAFRRVLDFVVYKAFSFQPQQMNSVVWQHCSVPPGGSYYVSWDPEMDYGVALAELDEKSNHYTIQDSVQGSLGSLYAIRDVSGRPNISSTAVETHFAPNQITIRNETRALVNGVGFTLGGKLIGVAERGVMAEEILFYGVDNVYFVAALEGEILREGAVLKPETIAGLRALRIELSTEKVVQAVNRDHAISLELLP